MTDTVTRLMKHADRYSLASGLGDGAGELRHRQALHDELVRLFTPLSDEQIGKIERGLPIDDYAHDLTRRVERLHGIGGES